MDPARIVLIHLSDIHFQRLRSGGIWDLDSDLRNELERDVRGMREHLGDVHGILVTGDIAFAGKPEEYIVALKWLGHLCGLVGCAPENVWTTPGNHDVDRTIVETSPLLQLIHRDLRPLHPDDIDARIEKFLKDSQARELTFAPIKNYNEFAAHFGCDIGPDRLYWEDNLTLNDGSILRLRGLNSTLVSDSLDNDGEYRLVLGGVQSTLIRHDGVEYLTLCHHPPQWLRDQDQVEEALKARVRIQLFGHKHHHKVEQINETVRIGAGAVHPERSERGWRPRYNYLTVAVDEEGDRRRLRIRVYPRVWSDGDRLFMADYNCSGSDQRALSLAIGPWRGSTVRQAPVRPGGLVPQPANIGSSPPALTAADPPGSGPMNVARRMTYRFLSLPYHVRMEVAQKLRLLKDEDKGVQDAELFKRFFRRAREKEILAQLWDEVESRYPERPQAENPFGKT